MVDSDGDAPKIQIDDDWKAQAQAEKEKLAETDKPGDGQASGPGEMPPATFETLLSTMITQALFALGAVPDPQSGQRYVSLDLAKHHIDMLGVLEEKTKGNLSDEESQALTQTLAELRQQFVQVVQVVREQAAEQAKPGQTPGPGTGPGIEPGMNPGPNPGTGPIQL